MSAPKGKGEIRFKAQRSEFIGLLHPLESVAQFQSKLKALKSDFPTAHHICWAYRLHFNSEIIENSSDAGEPGGTAGLPILNQLRKKDAVNVSLFVIRYFGGIKLGRRGLIDAYGKAAAVVIHSVTFHKWEPMIALSIEAELNFYGDILQVISKFESKILENNSNANLKLRINIPAKKRKELSESLMSGAFGKVIIKRSERDPNQGGY